MFSADAAQIFTAFEVLTRLKSRVSGVKQRLPALLPFERPKKLVPHLWTLLF
jgi:hypothetical protein